MSDCGGGGGGGGSGGGNLCYWCVTVIYLFVRECSGSKSSSSSDKKESGNLQSTIIPYQGKRNVLVIVCAGDVSLHDEERWYAPNRIYDLCVVYYGNDSKVEEKYIRESDYYHKQQGPKWQLIRSILKKGIHEKYEYIWMPVRHWLLLLLLLLLGPCYR